MDKVSLAAKLAQFSDHWSPKIVGEFNGMAIKLVKLKGEFVWHHHDRDDELFLVLTGRLRMRFRDREVIVDPGEFIIVPRGIDHMPIADDEVEVALIEPTDTLNTGNVQNERTVATLARI